MGFFKFLLVLYTFIRLSNCSHEFLAHNFVQYHVGGNDYGLPHLAVDGKLRYLLPGNFGLTDSSDKFLSSMISRGRTVYLLRLEDLLTKRFYWLFFKNVLKTNNVLLLTLPPKDTVLSGKNKKCDEAFATDFSNSNLPKCSDSNQLHQETLLKFEQFLYKSKPKCSLSVTEYNESVENVFNLTKSSKKLLGDDVRVNAKGFESNLVSNFLTLNLYGELNTEKSDSDNDNSDTKRKKILVTVNIDTFSVLQTYSSTTQNNSSLILTLELSRLLKDVKSEFYDLMFLFYSGSVINYSGLRHFLHNYKKDDIEFAVNFQDLSGDKLYFYTLNDFFTNLEPFLREFDPSFENVVKQENPLKKDETVDEENKEKDVNNHQSRFNNLSNVELNLPNELDTFKSFTVTTTSEATPLYTRCYSLNFKLDYNLLTQRTVDFAQVFLSLLKSDDQLKFDMEEIKSNVKKWDEVLSEPRNVLTTNLLLLDSVKEVVSHLESNLGKIQVQNFRTHIHEHKFYSSVPNNCNVFVAKHPAFDLLIVLAVTVYILTIWSLVRGSPKVAINDIADMFQQLFNEKNFKFKTK
ncbi:putative integral membrane protein [Theileria parva strain Muguga]|uniref:putative integral membrane protein n=1 Tax=Theileria parva strain Muguga TaxID=333668 RepID=UPI001C6181AE|nr:putative integral membrane protein [Theileria parva strain Muguga]EAN33746.2 putative integral membrane protein [Theileria parva strain Muguga]